MVNAAVPKRLARFGPYDFDFATGELRKHGSRIQLQPKPQQVLATLIENQGSVVTREYLKQRLWEDGTFVDFEAGLNTAINRLRLKLGDSADYPVYIETLSRSGYRFIAPVEFVAEEQTAQVAPGAPLPPKPKRRRLTIVIAATLTVAVIASAAVLALRKQGAGAIEYSQLTYRRGGIGVARFVPLSQTIIYSAQWDRSPRQFFVVQGAGPESRALDIRPELSLASVSRDGELALLQFGGTMNIGGGNLLRMPLTGSAQTVVDRSVMSADWTPDGKAMVIVRAIEGRNQLESPAGNVVYKTAGWLSNPRHSPVSNAVAFIEHAVRHDDAGRIMLYEQGRGVRPLTDTWASANGLGWRPRGDEIWFTAARTGSRSLWSVDTAGRVRPIAKTAGELTLRDIAADGRALATRDVRRLEMAGRLAGDEEEREYSWLDWSRVQEVGPAGRLVLFDESGEAARPHATAYIHDTVERTTRRLGNGIAMGLHPDGRSAMLVSEDHQSLFTVPVTGGTTKMLPVSGLRIQWAKFFPDGARLLVLGSRPNEGLRLYVCTLATPANLRAISEEMMIRNAAVSPDGREVAVLKPGGELAVYATDGGVLRTIYSAEPLAPLRWSSDGRSLYVQHLRRATDNSAHLSRLDLERGTLRPFKVLSPSDRTGVNSITGVALSPDCKHYVYSYRRVLSELYLVSGW